MVQTRKKYDNRVSDKGKLKMLLNQHWKHPAKLDCVELISQGSFLAQKASLNSHQHRSYPEKKVTLKNDCIK